MKEQLFWFKCKRLCILSFKLFLLWIWLHLERRLVQIMIINKKLYRIERELDFLNDIKPDINVDEHTVPNLLDEALFLARKIKLKIATKSDMNRFQNVMLELNRISNL